MTSYTVKVFLYEIEPQVWRRFTVPGNYSFAQLHESIQKAMGWNDEQAHQFRHGKGKRLTDVISNTQEEVAPGDSFQDEKSITLSEFIGRKKLPMRMMYRYDFFDDWTHEVVIEEKLDTEDAPKMLGGERACPPEDCGGAFGYKECMEGFAEWLDDDYDPEAFDPTKVNL
ncbi:MAG: plasmid pRiA4b ORF-3 family protein [Akkermansiaceae bacterium]